ncbi:uncharacterized protein LOC128021557 isoform X2 [Carassius gibelio]|uniref:uncharacterized protein LOC128021557 isoform X2 n=1 Tax=Carassius gibelio TaxID=101364 RepID=UPI00227807D1|nr:uncharacterized protein LOC128021557 isoform X2 [Carassius gibelio]
MNTTSQGCSNIEQQAFDGINTLAAIDPDTTADDFIQFITQPGFQTVIDLTQDGDKDPTVNVTDKPHILPDSTLPHVENPIGSSGEPLPGPSGEPARKKPRKMNRPTSPVSLGPGDEPPRKTYRFTAVVRPEPNGELPRKAYRFTPSISPESSPESKTLCLTPPNSPETELFYDSSRSHKDDVNTWGTSQIDAWDQSSWTSERDEVSTTNMGQTPYPSRSPSSEVVEVEEVSAPQPVDEPFDDLPPTHRPINSIESFGQEFRDAQVDKKMEGSDDLRQSDQSSTELTPDEIEMLSILSESLEQYLFNIESPAILDLFELAVNPNMNLFDPLLSLDNDPIVQHGKKILSHYKTNQLEKGLYIISKKIENIV